MDSPRPDLAPAQVLHRYVPGLRFDTMLALEHPGDPQRYRLRLQEHVDEADAIRGLLSAATACLAMPPRRPPRDIVIDPSDPGSVQALAARWLPELDCRWEKGLPRLSACAFRVMLVCLRHQDGLRWALVTGEEWLTGRQERPRALLLLDALLATPWGTGYNCRLELLPGSGLTLGARANPLKLPLAYRGIDGLALAVDVEGTLCLERRPTPPA